MPAFVKRSSKTYTRLVPVFLGDTNLGDLNITFRIVDQVKYEELLTENNDVGMCKEIIEAVGDIAQEGTEEKLSGQAAIDFVLSDTACVAACVGQYVDDFKSKNFRTRGAKKGR